MKIKVSYDPELNWLKIPVILKTSHKRISVFIVFDTGSPNTLLNYMDSRRLNIPFVEDSGVAKIGGNKYKSYFYNKLEVLFKTEEEQLFTETLPVKVLRPSSSKIAELEELDNFPNLLGLDFLKQGWKFFCDINSKEIYFEK